MFLETKKHRNTETPVSPTPALVGVLLVTDCHDSVKSEIDHNNILRCPIKGLIQKVTHSPHKILENIVGNDSHYL